MGAHHSAAKKNRTEVRVGGGWPNIGLPTMEVVINGPHTPPSPKRGHNQRSPKSAAAQSGTAHTRKPIPNDIRNNVWLKYHGERDIGACYCCGIVIWRYNSGWHCSHVQADVKFGSATIENLRACCRHCNLSMGDQNLYAYIYEKKLRGPGAKNVTQYFAQNPSQVNDRRTNNWGKRRAK